MDLDGDGKVTEDELEQFLQRKGIDDQHRSTIVQELFQKCDDDGSGSIELVEFVHHYVETKNQLV